MFTYFTIECEHAHNAMNLRADVTLSPERHYALGAVGTKDMTPGSNTDPAKVSDQVYF